MAVPGGILSVTGVVERRHRDVGAERRLGEGDRQGQREVVAARGRRPRAAVTCTTTNRSPAGPPRSPGPPRPVSRIRCAVLDPGRDAHGQGRARRSPRPCRAHVGQGVVTIVPAAAAGRGRARRTRTRPGCGWSSRCRGRPRRRAGVVPGAAPVPWQVAQASGADSRSGTVAPATASAKASVTSRLDVGAALGLAAAAGRRRRTARRRRRRTTRRRAAAAAWPKRSPRSKVNPPGPPAPGPAPPGGRNAAVAEQRPRLVVLRPPASRRRARRRPRRRP